MVQYDRLLQRTISTLCLAGAIVFAAESGATSLIGQVRVRTEEAVPAGEELRPFSGMVEVDRSAYAIHAEETAAWNELAPDAWPERNFSEFLNVLPALYGIRDGRTLSDSKKPLSDSAFRGALPAPSGDASHALLERADWADWNVRPTFALTAEELRDLLRQPRPLRLVDLRRKEDFAQFRVKESLNIPAFALKSKGFLTRRPFVLLDEGYEPHMMEALCEELRQAGLEASFLYGGLKAWKTSGGDLEGDVFVQRALDRMPASAFRKGLADERRLIVALDDALPSAEFPQAVALPYHGDPQEWLERFQGTLTQWTNQPELFLVVLVSRFGKEYDELEPPLRASRLPNLFVLDGGWQAYQDLLSREIVAQERGEASTGAPAGCPNCRMSCQ